MSKESILKEVISIEGGYVDDPSDSGGKTNYGITETVARANGYDGDMKDLTPEKAFNIYSKQYWDALNLDRIYMYSPMIAKEMVDTAVNMGVTRAGKFLQRSLNVLNLRQEYYKDLSVDGKVGNITIKAFESYYYFRNEEGLQVLYKMLNCLQGAFYIELAERREKDERFIYGWYVNRIT